MSSALGYRDLISMAEANSSAKQREIERKLRDGSGKGKMVDPKQAKLKVGVQKFLAKKEEEERRLKDARERKRKMLLELRSQDRKANSRVNRMLKMTKSANKSCIADAQECLSEACTAQASETQPDEDDYGYTSTFAAEMHKKMLEKYKLVPKVLPSKKSNVEVPSSKKFENPKVSSHHNPKTSTSHNVTSSQTESLKSKPSNSSSNNATRPKIPKKAALPPPPAFLDLLRLAEQKSKEPVVIKKPTKDMMDGPEFQYGRPMTAKEKAEYMSELELKQRVKANFSGGGPARDSSKQENIASTNKSGSNMEQKRKFEIPKIPKKESKLETALTKGVNQQIYRDPPQPPPKQEKRNVPSASRAPEQSSYSKSSPPFVQGSSGFKPSMRKMGPPPPEKFSKPDVSSRDMKPNRPSPLQHKPNGIPPKSRPSYSEDPPRNRPPQKMSESRPKPSPLRPSSSVPQNSRRSPSERPESGNRYEFPTRKKEGKPWKGRAVIHSDDEYDSEMDDFIDDSDVPQEDISNVIGQIFGYNKRKYANEESDDECMESSVTQQWQEEQRSLRIGIKEDLEELRREQEEEKRKAMYLKRKQKLK